MIRFLQNIPHPIRICLFISLIPVHFFGCVSTEFAQDSLEEDALRDLVVSSENVHPARIAYLINGGADSTNVDEEGVPLVFHIAKNVDDFESIEAVFEFSDIDFDYTDEEGYNTYHYILRHNSNLEVVEQADKIFSEELKELPNEETPLHLAVQGSSLEVIEYLLENEDDVNKKDSSGATPLLLAVKNNQSIEVLELLEKRGADIFVTDNENNTILHAAAESESVELLNYALSKGIDPTVANNFNDTPLDIAVETAESVDFIKTSLTSLASETDETNASALGKLAVRFDPNELEDIVSTDISEGLLQQSSENELFDRVIAETNSKPLPFDELTNLLEYAQYENLEYKDVPFLFYALRKYDTIEIIELLESYGADIRERTSYGETILHWAAQYSNNPSVVAYITRNAPDLLEEPELLTGSLPIHNAARYSRNSLIFAVLAESGRNMTTRNSFGESPYLLAQKNRNLKNYSLYWTYSEEVSAGN